MEYLLKEINPKNLPFRIRRKKVVSFNKYSNICPNFIRAKQNGYDFAIFVSEQKY